MELGIYTFGDLSAGARDPQAAQPRLKEIVAAAKLADEAGLHVLGVGEHLRQANPLTKFSHYQMVSGAPHA